MDTPEDLMDITDGLMIENTPILPDLINEVEDDDNDIVVHMDLRAPIRNLKKLVEKCVNVSLAYYQVWLQDSQLLEPHKNLVDQCVQGEGLVQINVQIQPQKRRINIVDVLKPTDDILAQLEATNETTSSGSELDTAKTVTPPVSISKSTIEDELPIPTYQISKAATTPAVPSTSAPAKPPVPVPQKRPAPTPTTKPNPSKVFKPAVPGPSIEATARKKNVIRWFVDSNFKQDQIRLKIPDNPEEWSAQHVQYWLKWAMRQFQLGYLKLHEWNLTGKELCAMTIQEFQRRIPNDPNDIFWTHMELLRKCKFVATIQKPSGLEDLAPQVLERQPTIHKKVAKVTGEGDEISTIGNRTGNNGQIQLWQFLLELLTSKEHREHIQWSGNEGEFKLLNAEVVAQLWGERKHKTTMTYEKLSRALRYYYDGDMISKVNGKRFTYRFVCDLKELIGYDAQELARLVEESDTIYDENSLQLD